MVDLAAQIWRDFNTDGVPASGVHKPLKSKIREWGTDKENRLTDAEADILARLPLTGGTLTGGLTMAALLTVNGQIKFPSTANPSSDVNTLDEYEEGTWTPLFTVSGSPTFTYSTQDGRYIKIGKLVHVVANIVLTNKGGSSGTLLLTGLPFATAAASADATLSFSNWQNFASVVGNPAIQVTAGGGTSGIPIHSGAAAHALLGVANLTNTSVMRFSGEYPAAA